MEAAAEEVVGDDDEAGGVRPILPYSSLFILSSTNPIRVGVHWLVTKPLFDGFIMFVILLSSAALAAEDPVVEDSPRNAMLKTFDYAFTAIFAIECFLKVRVPIYGAHVLARIMLTPCSMGRERPENPCKAPKLAGFLSLLKCSVGVEDDLEPPGPDKIRLKWRVAHPALMTCTQVTSQVHISPLKKAHTSPTANHI